jgi:hypothetical protein
MLDRMKWMKQDSESTPHPVNPIKIRALFPLLASSKKQFGFVSHL